MAISRKILGRTPIPIIATGTTFDTKVTFYGEVATRYILECYNSTGDRTRTLSFIDANLVTVWSGAAHADAGNYSVPIDVELDGDYTVRITLSDVAGDTGTDYLT